MNGPVFAALPRSFPALRHPRGNSALDQNVQVISRFSTWVLARLRGVRTDGAVTRGTAFV